LYLDDLAASWADTHQHIAYRRAISNPESPADDAFRGFVHQAVVADFPDLSGFDVYMSGPPAMIDAARNAFAECNLDKQRLFYDSFEFGLDVPVRVLARPH
jgi:CDP-4-dehydro-6-deoxyglucose reductase